MSTDKHRWHDYAEALQMIARAGAPRPADEPQPERASAEGEYVALADETVEMAVRNETPVY